MNNALTVYQPQSLSELMDVASILAKSGYFADAREVSQAVAKILAGSELGFGPMASMTGIFIVKGRVTMSANLQAAAVRRSGKYNYRVADLTDTACTIDFYENGERQGPSTFTMADAKRAGLSGDNWTKYPRNMLFARAMSNGVRLYCPDILGGPIYTPDELGAAVDDEGTIIEGRFSESTDLDHLNHSDPLPPAEPEDGKRRLTKDELADVHAYAKTMGVPTKEVLYHDILGVEKIEDFRSVDPKAEAYAAIELWYADQQKDDTGPDAAAEPQALFDVEQPAAEIAYE